MSKREGTVTRSRRFVSLHIGRCRGTASRRSREEHSNNSAIDLSRQEANYGRRQLRASRSADDAIKAVSRAQRGRIKAERLERVIPQTSESNSTARPGVFRGLTLAKTAWRERPIPGRGRDRTRGQKSGSLTPRSQSVTGAIGQRHSAVGRERRPDARDESRDRAATCNGQWTA